MLIAEKVSRSISRTKSMGMAMTPNVTVTFFLVPACICAEVISCCPGFYFGKSGKQTNELC